MYFSPWLQDPGPKTFWEANGDKVLLVIITALVTLLFQKLLPKIWEALQNWFASLGIGYQKRYLNALTNEHKWLHLIGIQTKGRLHPPRLKEVFVSLRLGKGSAAESAVLSWEQLFNADKDEEKRLVILGEPGAGKTTLLDYMTLVFTGEVERPVYRQLRRPVPLYVRLREVREGKSLMDLMTQPAVMRRTPKGYFERLLEAGKCIVLLDGLDEVLNAKQHERVVREIKQLVNEYPQNWYVLTCRVAGWKEQLPGFRLYQVQPLLPNEIQGFVTAWYREVERSNALDAKGEGLSAQELRAAEEKALAQADEQAQALWRALRKNSGLMRVARTPLILSLITLVHYVRQTELPKGRAQLYRRCLEILLEEWDLEDKRLVIPNKPSLNDKLLALKEIAFHFATHNILEMEPRALETLLEPLRSQFSVAISAKDFVRHIYERSGVLVETHIGAYGFAHRALQDYLTASYIVENNRDEILLQHTGEEPWQEMIRIAGGLMKQPQRVERLLNALLEKGRTDGYSLALAGWSLGEDVQVKQELRVQVRDRLLEALDRGGGPDLAAQWYGALTEVDGARAARWLDAALHTKEPESRRRVLSFIPALPPFEQYRFLQRLLERAANARTEKPLRIQILLTLAGLDVQPDGAVWDALARLRNAEDWELRQAANYAWCGLGRYEELGLVKVPAGEFLMGSDPQKDRDAWDNELPQHTLYLPDFYIGRYPVTVAEFREFVGDTGYRDFDQDALKDPDDHPVRWVTWYNALAYARWRDMTLPSEAEWEKAARGTDGRIYPWGDAWDPTRCNSRESGIGRPTPVGKYSPQGDSPYGCADMSGNVWEWTRSLYKRYPYDPADGREDLGRVRSASVLALRGGSWNDVHGSARLAARYYAVHPLISSDLAGFRVVLSPMRSGL